MVIKSNIIFLFISKELLMIEANPRSIPVKTLEILNLGYKTNPFNQKNN